MGGIENLKIPEKVVKWVEKLKDWSVKLSYSKETSMWMLNYTFNIKRSKENWKCYITNQTPDTPKNKWYLHNQKEKYEVSLASFADFFKSLWKALDSYIWRPRPSLSEEKWKKAFLLLWWKEKQELTLTDEIEEGLTNLKNEILLW